MRKGCISLAMVIVLLCFGNMKVYGQPSVSSADSLALVALYNSTDGANWSDRSGWLTAPVSQWFGITLISRDDVMRVSVINLDQNNLVGTIPAELGALTEVDRVILSRNALIGPIPNELGGMTNVRQLNLRANALSGQIPEGLGSLSQRMELLRLDDNALSGSVPAELGNAVKLQTFRIDVNPDLSGSLPQSLTQLVEMRTFNFANTGVCFPVNTAFESWLNSINSVTSNGTACEPEDPTVVDGPPRIATADSLALVALYNSSGGENWINNSGWLTAPLVDDQSWRGIQLIEVDNMLRVFVLDLENNNLTGTIPEELAALDQLDRLVLARNNLTGHIPQQIGNILGLRQFNLRNNSLTGQMPASLGNMTERLELLRIENNSLSGLIPEEIGNATKIEILRIDGNSSLEGSLPRTFLQLTAVRTLNFFNTGVCEHPDAAFQAWLSGINSLSRSGLTCGTTELPRIAVADSLALVALYNSTNGPGWASHTGWLTAPLVDDNSWFGIEVRPIDGELRVTLVNLENNLLVGTLPPELGNLTELDRLLILRNFTGLTGTIPQEITNLTKLRTIVFRNNSLTGPIPSGLDAIDGLEIFRLDNNNLSGPLPDEIGNLPRLRTLRLDGSQNLSGPIPMSFTNLQSLTLFTFPGTSLCEPADPDFQAWINGVTTVTSTGICRVFQQTITSADSLALVRFYELAGGDTWTENSGWLQEMAIDWYGVTIDESSKQVRKIELPDNNLNGILAPEIGNLAGLDTLVLFNNNLTGEIPANFGELFNLRLLSLRQNSIEGSIPQELGQLRELRELILDENDLSGELPESLNLLKDLRTLRLRDNPDLSGAIPMSFTELSNLFLFWFDQTGLCEPSDRQFQDWLAGVSVVLSSGIVCQTTSIVDEDSSLPLKLALNQNYPNPFNPSTSISIELPSDMHVRLAVYDVLGREVALLSNQYMSAGVHTLRWNGAGFASGMYAYRLITEDTILTRSMMLVK